MQALPVGDDERYQIRVRMSAALCKLITSATALGPEGIDFVFDGWGGKIDRMAAGIAAEGPASRWPLSGT
jgi:hypothetical protein